jgi:SagB-type dehydrogenase family enzyme
MEARRSVRRHGTEPVSLERLSEFLYRTARVRGLTPASPGEGRPYDVTDRPYPNGGGAYELECYLTVRGHDELGTGCYHYDAAGHRLIRLGATEGQVRRLLADAAAATAGTADPRLLLTLTSRFERLAWKYSGMAYAITLKNTGVLLQSMYLVATAMGLAPCALGNGDTPPATAALGLDDPSEVPVGEFILGTLPPGDG